MIRFIPIGAARVQDKHSSAVAYLYERDGSPCAIAYGGNAVKAEWRFRFRNEGDRNRKIKAHFEMWQGIEAARKARKEERAAELAGGHQLQLGHILASSWGYDQTNVDFFEVTAIKGKCMVELRQIGSKLVDANSSMSGHVIPMPGSFKGDATRHRATRRGVRVGHQWASLWDGRPMYNSWYA